MTVVLSGPRQPIFYCECGICSFQLGNVGYSCYVLSYLSSNNLMLSSDLRSAVLEVVNKLANYHGTKLATPVGPLEPIPIFRRFRAGAI